MTPKPVSPTSRKPLKLSQKLILAFAPPILAALIRVLYFFNRESIVGENRLEALMDDDNPKLVAVWHENGLILVPKFASKNIHALASQSRDGELGARLLKYFGVECVRGSSSRGGANAINEMVKIAPNVRALGITIDGPRGPRRKSKPGIVVLALRTGFPILPVAASATKSIRVNSWDRTCIPLPFGRYVYAIGDLIPPPESSDKAAIAAKILEVEKAMNDLQESLETEFGIDPLLAPETPET